MSARTCGSNTHDKIIATSNSGSIPASTKRKASHSQSERKGDMALADHREAAIIHPTNAFRIIHA